MGKRILIGSMLVLVLLLLMPSIPAIQQKTIEEGFKQDLKEKLDSITFDELKDIKNLEWIRHPILYFLVMKLMDLRYEQLSNTARFWMDLVYTGHIYLVALGVLRCFWIAYTIVLWSTFWYNLSNKLQWNWDIVPEYP